MDTCLLGKRKGIKKAEDVTLIADRVGSRPHSIKSGEAGHVPMPNVTVRKGSAAFADTWASDKMAAASVKEKPQEVEGGIDRITLTPGGGAHLSEHSALSPDGQRGHRWDPRNPVKASPGGNQQGGAQASPGVWLAIEKNMLVSFFLQEAAQLQV